MQRPIVFWGLDPLSRSVAAALVQAVSQGAAGPVPRMLAFEPVVDARRELRETLVSTREAARLMPGSPEPRVVLLSTTFGVDVVARLGRLQEVSDILDVIQPGLRSLALAVLVPPQVADEHEKVETFECFLRLEQTVDTIPYLDVVFVNQLPVKYYLRQAGSPDEELIELLTRQFCDGDVAGLVDGVGRQLVALGRRVADRKCVYATVGSFRMRYLADDALRHVEARLCHDVFTRGFLGNASSDERRLVAQRRTDETIDRYRAMFSTKGGDRPFTIAGEALAAPAGNESTDEQLGRFRDDMQGAVDTHARGVVQIISDLPRLTRHEIAAVLAHDSRSLDIGTFYCEALRGTPVVQTEEEEPRASGARQLDQVLCRDRLRRELTRFFEEDVSPVIAPHVSIAPGDDLWRDDRLARVLNRAATISAPAPTAAPARFAAASATILLRHLDQSPGERPSILALIERLARAFAAESATLAALLQSRDDDEAASNAALARAGWVTRHLVRRSEQQALKRRIVTIRAEKTALHEAHAAMHALLMTLLNRVLLPQALAARFSNAFEQAVHAAARELEDFIAQIATRIDDRLQAAALPAIETTTVTSIVTAGRAEALLQQAVDGRTPSELADHVLRYAPPVSRTGGPPAYTRCHDLGEHFLAGAGLLLERMRDWADAAGTPVRELDILDVMELGDADTMDDEPKARASACLRSGIASSRRFLEFSEGMWPLVEHEQATTAILLVRVQGGDRSRLSRDYGDLFGPNRHIVASNDPSSIEIVCFTVPFPAFVIHGLDEGRRLWQATPASHGIDLWPQVLPVERLT